MKSELWYNNICMHFSCILGKELFIWKCEIIDKFFVFAHIIYYYIIGMCSLKLQAIFMPSYFSIWTLQLLIHRRTAYKYLIKLWKLQGLTYIVILLTISSPTLIEAVYA